MRKATLLFLFLTTVGCVTPCQEICTIEKYLLVPGHYTRKCDTVCAFPTPDGCKAWTVKCRDSWVEDYYLVLFKDQAGENHDDKISWQKFNHTQKKYRHEHWRNQCLTGEIP